MTPDIIIPAVPGGIFNPADLLNDDGANPIARWDNPEFHDRILWVNEQQPFIIGTWGSAFANAEGPGPGAAPHRGSTFFTASLPNGKTATVDVLNIVTDPRSAYVLLYALANGKAAPEIPIYPGYAIRHPAGGKDPVGDRWPEHPSNAENRVIFHPSKDFSEQAYPWLGQAKPVQFFRPDGRYTLEYIWQAGGGMWGAGGKRLWFWQRDSTVLGG